MVTLMSLDALTEPHHVACHQTPAASTTLSELFLTRPNLETIDCYQQTREQMRSGIETITIEAVPGSSLREKAGDYLSTQPRPGQVVRAKLFQARQHPVRSTSNVPQHPEPCRRWQDAAQPDGFI